MANISSANGTLTLKGDWTEAAVEALKPVLDAWKFYGEYGMRVYEYPTVDKTTIEFNGSGRWSFSGTLGGILTAVRGRRSRISPKETEIPYVR